MLQVTILCIEPNPNKSFAHEIGKRGRVVKSLGARTLPTAEAKYAHSSEPILNLDANMRDLVLGVGLTRGLCLG